MKSLLSAARKALDEADFKTAIENCDTVIDQDPNNYNAHLFKGFAFSKIGKDDEAIKEFEVAVSLNPESPLAFQGLIAATQKNPSRLISYYERLAALHAKQQPLKYYEDLIKMVDIYKTLNDHASVIKIWEKMLQSSPEYDILKDHIQFNSVEIWSNILQIALEKDNYDYEKEWQTQKYRIQSKSMDLVKKDIEKEINLKSKVGEAIENILIHIQKDKVYFALCNQLIVFLYKRLEFTENLAHKEKILQRIFQICSIFRSISGCDIEHIEPFRIEFEINDYAMDGYDLDIVERIAATFKDTKFGFNCALISSIRNDRSDIRDLISNITLSETDDFITCQVMAAACGSVGLDEQALEWGNRGQVILKSLSEISGISYDKRSEELNYFIASRLFRLGGSYLAESLSIYRKLLDQNPSNQKALLGICEIYIKLQNWKEAAEYADKCLAIDINDHQALAAKGWVAFHENNLELAMKLIKKATDLYRDATYLYMLGRIYWEMGGCYRTAKEYALSHFLQSAKENTKYAPPFCYLGYYYDLVEHDTARAIKCFQKSIQLDPLNSEANKALVMLKLAANNDTEAIELLQAYCDRSPRNDWAHKLLGDLLINSARYADAIFHFNQSLRYDDKNPSLWTSLGQALSHEGKYVAGSKAFERALSFSHDEDEKLNISYLISAIHLKLGNAAEASNILQKIIAAIPNHLPTRIKLIEAHIGLAHEKREEGSKAGYQIILENALRVAVDGFNYPTKSVWLFRFVGRILTLFLKDNMECNADLLVKLLDALKKFAQDSDSKFLDDYHSSFTSFPLFKCCVISLIVSCRQAHEFADLQALCLYDLALCTYYGYMRQEENILILRKAIQIIRICIDILPDSDLFWNAAGVFLQSVDLARSQHCFIKATYLSNSESAWVNLVLLASKNDDNLLSRDLINHALISAPENPKLWLAKSFIAGSLYQNEYQSILEHAFELSDGELPDINFLYLEHSLKCDDPKRIEIALSSIHKTVEFMLDDIAYINLLAMAYERLGNYRQSLTLLGKIFHLEDASKFNESETIVDLASNASRLLCSNSLYKSAMEIYHAILDRDAFQDSFNLIFLSLCYFNLERYEDCLKTMDTAIEHSTDAFVETELLITLGRIIFSIEEIDGNIEIAKEQFFKCITHDISLTDALFGLLAISIVSNDKIISESVLKELNKCQIYSTDIFYWIGAYHELSGNNKAARTSYLKSCHQFPTSLTSWNHLLRFFLKTEPESAIFARRSLNSILDSYRFPEKVDIYIENLYLEGSYLFCIGSIDDSRKILTKAFHLQPENPKILASLYLCQTTDTGRNHISQNLEILKDQGSKEAIDLLARIRLHFDENNLKEAKSIIAHLENSQDNDANLDMSILFYYLGDYERALASINKYLNKCSSINGLEILAAVNAKLQLWSEAESAHNRALELCRRPAEQICILYRLLKHYMELGNHKSASEILNKLYQTEGESSMQKLVQAILQKRNGNQTKFQKILETIDSEYRNWFDLI